MPLAQRLTLMFVLIATTVLLLLGKVIASSVEQHFEDLDKEVLSGKMELIAQALQGVSSDHDLTGLTHQLARSLVGHHGLEVMVMEADRSVIFATANANFSADQVVELAEQQPGQPALWHVGQVSYRGLAAKIPTSALNRTGPTGEVFVAAAIDIAHHQTYMKSFLQTLWWFVVGAAGLMAVLGWLAVRRGLAPLDSMREQAQVVTAQQLSRRLAVQHMPVELAQLAQSLNDMLARLEDAFSRLSDFSSDIAHELRTPVSNLMTQTQVSLSRPRDAASYREILESNAEEFERLSRMISDMLYLAKAESTLVAQQLVSHGERVDLAQEVRDLFEFYEALAEEKGIGLKLEGSGQVMGNRPMLRRAISNLVSNALRYTPHGEEVLVTIATSGQQTVLRIENPGDTIAPAQLPRLFERFYRADASRHHSQNEGTGLGLAITQAIVHSHHGQVGVTSVAGRTCFSIQLAAAG
jgi:two-component system heavy metal sensor histidine kinase CusS